MEYAIFIPGARTDHPIAVLYLAGIDVVNLFTTVLLTNQRVELSYLTIRSSDESALRTVRLD